MVLHMCLLPIWEQVQFKHRGFAIIMEKGTSYSPQHICTSQTEYNCSILGVPGKNKMCLERTCSPVKNGGEYRIQVNWTTRLQSLPEQPFTTLYRGVMKLWHLYVTPRAEQALLSQALARLGSVQPVRPAAPIGFQNSVLPFQTASLCLSLPTGTKCWHVTACKYSANVTTCGTFCKTQEADSLNVGRQLHTFHTLLQNCLPTAQ